MLSGGLRTGLIDFSASRSGVSAVEFSLIAPILLLMFMASIELPRAYMIGKRLDNATATMADLISRGNYTDLSPVFAALEAIANPYDVSRASIVLTAGGTYQTQTGAASTTSAHALVAVLIYAVGLSATLVVGRASIEGSNCSALQPVIAGISTLLCANRPGLPIKNLDAIDAQAVVSNRRRARCPIVIRGQRGIGQGGL